MYVLVKVLDIRACVFWFRYLIMLMRFSHSVALSSQTIAMSHDRFAPKTEFVFRAFRICLSLLEVVKDYNSRKLKCRMYHVQIN